MRVSTSSVVHLVLIRAVYDKPIMTAVLGAMHCHHHGRHTRILPRYVPCSRSHSNLLTDTILVVPVDLPLAASSQAPLPLVFLPPGCVGDRDGGNASQRAGTGRRKGGAARWREGGRAGPYGERHGPMRHGDGGEERGWRRGLKRRREASRGVWALDEAS
ncbi:hypothetical protein K439DRAFT_570529 [Ramaria rubella]|nr:hypothetical protein K439DRAFT_570529 [Ramaria rubella]